MIDAGRTLVIETASEACSIALFEGAPFASGDFASGELLAHDHRVLGRGHAERLIPMIAALPENGHADTILTSLGPGSFTGVRIGIAAARALGVAWGAKVMGYPTLSLIAAIARSDEAMAAREKDVTVCVNGGHGEWFVQDFAADGLAQGDASSLKPDDAANRNNHPCLAGNRAEELAETQMREGNLALSILPSASHAHLLPHACLSNNLSPIYGRAPDAVPAAKQARSA